MQFSMTISINKYLMHTHTHTFLPNLLFLHIFICKLEEGKKKTKHEYTLIFRGRFIYLSENICKRAFKKKKTLV